MSLGLWFNPDVWRKASYKVAQNNAELYQALADHPVPPPPARPYPQQLTQAPMLIDLAALRGLPEVVAQRGQEPCWIWDMEREAYFRPRFAGYTHHGTTAGIYTLAEAFQEYGETPPNRLALEMIPPTLFNQGASHV